jgi:hypothetical protein
MGPRAASPDTPSPEDFPHSRAGEAAVVAAAAPGLGYVLWGQLRQAYVELGYTPGAELSVALELNT